MEKIIAGIKKEITKLETKQIKANKAYEKTCHTALWGSYGCPDLYKDLQNIKTSIIKLEDAISHIKEVNNHILYGIEY